MCLVGYSEVRKWQELPSRFPSSRLGDTMLVFQPWRGSTGTELAPLRQQLRWSSVVPAQANGVPWSLLGNLLGSRKSERASE